MHNFLVTRSHRVNTHARIAASPTMVLVGAYCPVRLNRKVVRPFYPNTSASRCQLQPIVKASSPPWGGRDSDESQ